MIITTILSGIVVMAACTKKKDTPTAATVSFSGDILPIFRSSCAINSDCHIGATGANDNIDLTDSLAYTSIIKKHLTDTSFPQSSVLYSEVALGVMPKEPYTKLPADKVTLILNWIKQGAKNN